MGCALTETRIDKFLNGRLHIRQPVAGYRAAMDPVLLAAAVPAASGQRVLELGCGVGVALLALGARVPGLVLTGLERQADYAQLACENAREAGQEAQILTGDLAQMPPALRAENFDHVLTNPPFFPPQSASAPQDPGRAEAHLAHTPLAIWLDAGLRRLVPGGHLTMIHRSEALGEILAGLAGRAGDIRIKPIAPRAGRDANRVIVSARKGRAGPLRLCAPLIIHDAPQHIKDGPDFSAEAAKILRDMAQLLL